MSKYKRVVYPFPAIIGQEKMKKGLLLNAVNPRLGGILVRGEKGTAKSTAVRALASLLPEIGVVMGCPFNCDPNDLEHLCDNCRGRLSLGKHLEETLRQVQVNDLPVSATEDRVVGSLDFEYAIKYGRPRFEPGLLARANRGIIYVDEVNLLDDHIVDVLLDAAAMGVNVVEREGISYVHTAEFILVGTMNPEEGDLRPQLIDRFGLCIQIEGVTNPRERVEIAKRREAFDADPLGFIAQWSEEERNLRDKIIAARQLLSKVTISSALLNLIAKLSLEAFVAGHRADIIMEAAGRTIAAWHGRLEVTEADVYEAAEMVLFHRVREVPPPPPEQPEPPQEEQEEPPEQEEEEENQEQDPPDQPETEEMPPPPEQENMEQDVLLDSAAMGVNTVEREGVSFTHPANFILVGTMNPEEGELRPQLLDRFGLCVNITGIGDPALRVEVVKRRAAFEDNPESFSENWEVEEERLRRQIVSAKALLPSVKIADEMLFLIAQIAIEMGVDGHRADLVMMKAAKTMAAFNGREEVTEEDVRNSVDLALLHRMRRKPFQELSIDRQKLQGVMTGANHKHTHDHGPQ